MVVNKLARKRPQTSSRSRALSVVLVAVLALAALLTAVPLAGAADPNNFALDQSRKLASKSTVVPGETFTYTIELVNSGNQDLGVWVADSVPDALTYVPGSASNGAVFNAGTSTLTWDVQVPAGDTLPLTFQVTASTVTTPTEVVNVAAISSVYQRFVRTVKIMIVPEGTEPPPAGADFTNSRKIASAGTLQVGEIVTYTIELVNSGALAGSATVTDPIPSHMTYVDGSATGGGVYDPDTERLTWSDVAVGVNGTVAVSFQAQAMSVPMPTTVVNRATIVAGDQTLVRQASVLVTPSGTPPPPGNGNLAGSRKLASKEVLVAGETMTYTIQLVNSGDAEAVADVVDSLPNAVSYVDGSASAGGVYHSDSATLSWDAVAVPANSTVDLTFQVIGAPVNIPTAAVNHASIASTNERFVRTATTLVVPAGSPALPPNAILAGSRKTASQRSVTGGQTFTYSIHLINSGTADALVDVTDPLPLGVEYVAESATSGGAYDAGTRTLAWTDVAVPAGDSALLSFDVTANPVTRPNVVVNRATISTDEQSFERTARVLVLPQEVSGDVVLPKVDRVRIGDQDVLTDPNVTVNVEASDNVGVTSMKIQEWVLVEQPYAHWEVVQTSEWMPFQTAAPWTLTSESGTHYVGVWVSDDAGNVSLLTQKAIDSASLLLANTAVAAGEKVAYLVHYQAGTDVTVSLSTLSGDADLYVWFPGNYGLPNEASTLDGTAPDQVSFTTPTDGLYLIVVHGYLDSVFDLSISSSTAVKANSSQAATSKPGLQADTILTASGVDPVAGSTTPQALMKLRLPLITVR